MKGLGIEETLEQEFGPNAVTHMMSGKAITRALHGLFLIKAALSTKILSNLLPHDGERNKITDTTIDETRSEELSGSNNEAMEIDEHPTFLNHNKVIALKNFVSDVLNQNISPDKLAESEELVSLGTTTEHVMNELSKASRTAELWLDCL